MYADAGVNPMFGALPTDKAIFERRDLRERVYLRDHLSSLGSNPKLEQLLEKYRVHYVYFNSRTYFPYIAGWSLAELTHISRLQQVFRRGSAYVFKISPPNGVAVASGATG